MHPGQIGLFTGPDPVGPAQPRPARPDQDGGAAEAVQVEPGVWTLVVYQLIPKLGYGHLEFPHYLCGPVGDTVWRVDRHAAAAPGGAFLFDSRDHVDQVAAAFGTTDLRPFMGRIEIPADDLRRR